MEFACDRCQRQFSTSYQPVAGRVYRIPCKCGNDIVLRFDLPQRAKPPPRAAFRVTPPPLPDRYLCMMNGRARAGSTENANRAGERAPGPDITAPLHLTPAQASPAQQTSPTNDATARVRLHPTATPEVTGEYPYEPSTSVPFGLALALSRRRAFLAGCAAGASGAIALAGAVTLVAWLSGPRSENPVELAPSVTLAPTTEQVSAPLAAAPAAAPATAGDARAAQDVPRRAKQAPRVVAAPHLVEEVAAPRPTAVDPKAAPRAVDDEGDEDGPASDGGWEPKQLAEAADGEAADVARARAEEPSDEPQDRIALVPAIEPEQAPASDGALEAPASEDRAQ